MKSANLEFEANIFEFCEQRFDELEKADNGYYSDKHDDIVFNDVAKKYNISKEQGKEMFLKYTKKTSDIYLKKKGEMTKQQMMKEMMAIVKNNKSFPYREDDDTVLPKLQSHSDLITENYKDLSKAIGEHGWTIPGKFTFHDLDNLMKLDNSVEEYDNFFNQYFNDINVKHIITQIKETKKLNSALIKLFNECVQCFWNGSYQISVNALISVLEGILSTYWPDKNNIRMMIICEKNYGVSVQQHQAVKGLIWNSICHFIKMLYSKSEFQQDEPSSINRHWVLHGRTQTEWQRIDCIRLFVAIYSVAIMVKKNH